MYDIPTRPIVGPSVWNARSFATRRDWSTRFDAPSLADLDRLHHVVGEDANAVPPSIEGFPDLAALLQNVHTELVHGSGVVLLSGFPVERYTQAEIEALYMAIGRMMGRPVSQNSYGDVLGHVRDEGKRTTVIGDQRGARGYLSNDRLLFHTDLGDCVGLLCLRPAVQGGRSSVSSSMAVFNEILAKHPEYLPVYFQGFGFRSTEADSVQKEWRLPVYSWHENMLSCAIRRVAIETSRLNGFPYSELEDAALDFLDRTASCDELRYDMQLESGDIQFLNNYVTFHARTGFVDADDPKLKRHLLRLWIQFPDGRSFLRRYPTIYDGVPRTMQRG